MLASTLKGIVSLRLIPSIQGGLVPAVEVMVTTGTIKEYIVDPDKTYLIRDAMEEGQYYGMQTFRPVASEALPGPEDHAGRRDRGCPHNSHDFKIKVRQLGITAEQPMQPQSL